MSVILSSPGTTTVEVPLPPWVLWGVGVAFGLTFGLLLIASLFAVGFTALTGGWLGGAEPWKEFRATFKAFIVFGLPAGLVSSYIWSTGHPWYGVASGLAVLGVIWWAVVRIGKKRQVRFY